MRHLAKVLLLFVLGLSACETTRIEPPDLKYLYHGSTYGHGGRR